MGDGASLLVVGLAVGEHQAPFDCTLLGMLQPFSQKSHTPTVATEFQIGLYDPTEGDLEHFGNCCSDGYLGERLYSPVFFEGMSICAASLWQPSICNSLGAGASTGKQPVAGRQFRGSFAVVVVPLISAGGWNCPQHSQPRAAASRRGSTISKTSWLLHYPALARPLRLRSGRPVVVV